VKWKTLIWRVVILLIVILVGGGTYYALAMQAGEDVQTTSSSATATQTAVARRGDLVIFASGTGELVALGETNLKFDEDGTLVELLVSVGDQVSEGDVLARLQVNKTEKQLAAEIANAELAVVEAQQALDVLYEQAELKAAQALLDLETAQEEREALQDNDLAIAQAKQAVVQAEEAIEQAEMRLYIHNSSASEGDIYTAYASMLFKEKTYNELGEKVEQLEYEYKKTKGKEARDRLQAQIDRTMAQMYNAQVAYEEALYRYESIDDPANPNDINMAQTQR
jgi:multidrug efflux pump subunit AcrA (membrane-fusion protein)